MFAFLYWKTFHKFKVAELFSLSPTLHVGPDNFTNTYAVIALLSRRPYCKHVISTLCEVSVRIGQVRVPGDHCMYERNPYITDE